MSSRSELYSLFQKYPVVSTDTRKIVPDSIFFALKGETFDGNQFAERALQSGAKVAVVDNPEYHFEHGTVLVNDVLESLQELAQHHRRQMPATVIGITGSNGKTTTKELLNAVLSSSYKVLATEGNLNNHIGVPLTLLRLNMGHEYAIIEMGANHLGEIAFLSSIAEPDFGLITNIGKAHLKGFGSYEGVLKAKTELYHFIRERAGRVFVNADDEMLMQKSNSMERITYGIKQADYKASPKVLPAGTMGLELESGKVVNSQLFGSYNFYNLLTAFAVGSYFEVGINKIREALEGYQPKNNRSQFMETGENKMILDAYNANPSSVSLALASFKEIAGENKLVILGDMFELGEVAAEEHKKIVDQLNDLAFDNVILVGNEFSKIAGQILHFEHTSDCLNYLKENPPKNQFILLKGSRGMKLERILDVIP